MMSSRHQGTTRQINEKRKKKKRKKKIKKIHGMIVAPLLHRRDLRLLLFRPVSATWAGGGDVTSRDARPSNESVTVKRLHERGVAMCESYIGYGEPEYL